MALPRLHRLGGPALHAAVITDAAPIPGPLFMTAHGLSVGVGGAAANDAVGVRLARDEALEDVPAGEVEAVRHRAGHVQRTEVAVGHETGVGRSVEVEEQGAI